MSKSERKFNDGDVIYLQNDPGDQAYKVVEGNVELSKSGEKGRVRLALLKQGDTFGGVDGLENGLHTSTARAIGPVTVRSISGDDDMPSQTAERDVPTTPQQTSARKGFFTWLFGANADGARPDRIDIRVAEIKGQVREVAEEQTRHLVAMLGKRKRVRARPLNAALPESPNEGPAPTLRMKEEMLKATVATARDLLKKADADLMIWGEIPPPGTTLHLRFVSAAKEEEDHPGLFLPSTTFNLPVGFGPELSELLLAVSLAATETSNDSKSMTLQILQAEALKAAMPVVQNPPLDLTTRERAAIRMCFGNALAREAARNNSSDLYQLAAQTYRTALEGISRDDSPIDWAITHKHLGTVLQALGERANDEQILNAAADSFGEALKELTKEEFPREWAGAQNRLGMMLYKIDVMSGDTELLKHALTAFQSALQVFTRAETPLPWAETMNNFAQAAQVLGEQHRNPEVLEKAIRACRSALEVRKKEKMPLLWAATQNNLGSALFLLGKLKKDLGPLNEAAEAFGKAHDFYTAYGSEKMAAIAAKNMSHATRLLNKHAPQGVPKMKWEKDTP